MALLQIAEPGQSAAPHQHKRGIGIDLGTTNSLVATVRSAKADTIKDDQGRSMLPSVVHFGPQQVLLGHEALPFMLSDPLNTIASAKRLIGRSLADVNLQHFPYQFAEHSSPHIQTRSGLVNPVEVSAKILKVLAMRAAQALEDDADGAVITVPAYFDDAQRQGTKDAAKLAGLHVLRLLNEPTAAAIAYGLDSGDEGLIAVYDLGGGTFDISVLRLSKGIFEVLATGGDSALGGDDFDHTLVNYLLSEADFNGELSVSSLRTLQSKATALKIALSEHSSAELSLELDEFSLKLEISRTQFEDLIAPLVKKTLRAVKRSLRDADVQVDDIDNVIMVGGSTRVPMVREQVASLFGCQPLTSIDPDQVVAIGAAIQADILVGNKPDGELLLLDVTPLSLGLETMGGLVEKIIPRNTTIPVARAQEFTTFKDGQTQMAVHVLQGERELVDDCRSLARFTLKDIPPFAAGAAHIRVTFQIDADGLLSVTAMEKSSGVSASVEVKPSYGLKDEQVAKMLKDSIAFAQQDVDARMLKEQQVEAARLIENMQAALNADAKLLEHEPRLDIENCLTKLHELATGSDIKAIEAAIKALDVASQDFASLRMDYSIRAALKGQAVDNL